MSDQDETVGSGGIDAASEATVGAGMQAIREASARQLDQIGLTVQQRVQGSGAEFAPDLPDALPIKRIAELEAKVQELEPWLQGPFKLAGNFVIPGVWRNDLRWQWLGENLPDLSGHRVLDVGSNAGYDPFMFKLRGAAEVLACEPFEFIHQARFLESIYHSGVDFQQIGWQDLDVGAHGRFDFVHCHGVLYHEPHPMMLLQKLRQMIAEGGEMLFGSLMHASSEQSEYVRFVPDAYAGDSTWWFVPGRLAMRWMLEVVGFDTEEVLISDGVRGEFPTVAGYFRCRPSTPAPELATAVR
jgi:2-polyprenyl-3-methyl-5-hydroxy-6-metoxy-1,4-benzoquinol methylase